MALGVGSQATHTDAVAIGPGAATTADSRLTLGAGSSSYQTPGLTSVSGQDYSLVVTNPTGVLGALNIGMLPNDTTFCVGSGQEATCYGENARSQGAGTTAMGANSVADSGAGSEELVAATALGARTEATGAGSTALGTGADASGEGSISSGMNSSATGRGSLAYGFGANATAENTMAMGGFASANGDNSVAIGAGAIANGRRAIAFGAGAQALGFNTDPIAFGTNALSDGTATTSYGGESKATGTNATAMGAYSTANGVNAVAMGSNAIANGRNVIAIGAGAQALGFNTNSLAIGTQAFADGTDVTALGAGARATGTRSTAVGAGATTTRNDQLVLGTASTSVTTPSLQATNEINADAINESMGMVMTNADGSLKRTNVVTADSTAVTINGGSKPILLNSNTTAKQRFDTESSMRFSGMASNGSFAGARDQNVLGEKRMLTVDGEGNAGTSQFNETDVINTINQVNQNNTQIDQNTQQIDQNITNIRKNKKKINKLEGAASALGDAAQAAGAMGAALSGVPELSLLPDEPMRCGFAGGGYGSQYAIAGGCAARIKDSIHLNGAIAYAPSIDYSYGSTSSLAGRLGISFPIGKSKSSSSNNTTTTTSPSTEPSDASSANTPADPLWYRTEVKQEISKLQVDLSSRDQQIQDLKTRLEQLMQAPPTNGAASQASDEIVALLKQRIAELEEEKKRSEEEDQRQNAQIEALEKKLADQESRFEKMMKRIQSMVKL